MRIGLSTSVIQRGQSGVGQYTLSLLRALLKRRDETQFTLFVLADDVPLFGFARGRAEVVTVPENFRSPWLNILWHQVWLPRLTRQHQLDLLHVPSYRRLIWRQPCSLAATIHDLAPFHCRGKYDPLRTLYGRAVVPWLARRQHRIIAVSEHTARDLEQYFRVPRSRIAVIHNGIDHQRFTPGNRVAAEEAVAARYGLRPPFFLYVARLEHPAKNHLGLLSAFAQFKTRCPSPCRLVLVGSDWHGADRIHAAVRASPFAQDIYCLGFVPDVGLPELYRAATALVYPSLYEGFGIPPIEAMACGCPVLSSTRGALGEVLGTAAATCDPENLEALAFQLGRLALEPELRERLRAAGFLRAREFDWNRSADATREVYALTIGQKAGRETPGPVCQAS